MASIFVSTEQFMIISAAKLAANRANAQLSTGPKTEEGKAAVSKNAVRHGLSSTEVIVRDGEREEFENLQAELLEEVSPEGPSSPSCSSSSSTPPGTSAVSAASKSSSSTAPPTPPRRCP